MSKVDCEDCFKTLFATAIVFWLIHQGKLDFSLIGKAFQNPKWLYSDFLFSALAMCSRRMALEKLVELKTGRSLPLSQLLN